MEFTWQSVNNLYAKGMINAKERSELRTKLLLEQNQFDGIHTKLINHLVTDFSKGWADLVVSLKAAGGELTGKKSDSFIPPEAEAAWHAFALLTGSPLITAIGKTAGESLQDVFLKRGVNNDAVNVLAALLDAGAQVRTGQALATVTGAIPKAAQVYQTIQTDKRLAKALSDAIPESLAKKAEGMVNTQAKVRIAKEAEQQATAAVSKNVAATTKEAEKFLESKAPQKGLEDLITTQAPAAKTAAAKSEAVDALALIRQEEDAARMTAAMKSQDETHDLLAKAMETLQPKEASPTSKTLDAAMATLKGIPNAEQTFNAAQVRKTLERSGDNLLEHGNALMSTVNPRLIAKLKAAGKTDEEIMRIITPSGGAPSYQDYINAGKRAQASYAEGKRILEMGKTKIADIEELSRTMVGKTLDDLKNITPGDPVDALEVIANSMAVKDHAQELTRLIGTMRKDWIAGKKDTFYSGLGEFYRILEVDPQYRMPLQTAGQALRAAGNPAVNSTRYLDDITNVGSWLGGEKLNTVNELEANALNIIGRLEQIPSWEKAANLAKQIASQKPEELLDPTFRDKARFIFVNSIMSGTDTIGRNIAGNMIAAPWHYAEKMTGTLASKVLDPFSSAKHHVELGYASEANNFITTWASSMWDASRYALTGKWQKLAEMVPEKARAELFAGRYDLPKFANTGTTNPFTGTTGKIIGTPTGIAQMADEVARVALYRGAVAERLKHEWLASGSPLSWAQFREQGFANPPPDMHEYGVRLAGLMTYSDDPSVFGRLIMQGRQAIPGSEFMIPFVKTTDRLMAYGYNRMPVLSALSTKTVQEFTSGDPLKRQEAIGRILLANITGAGLFLAARGKAPDGETFITGGGPTNRALAKSLRDGGVIHPYTFWTPAGRVGYHLWQPLAAPLGMIADASEIWDEIKTPDAEGLWTGITLAVARNFVDTTYNQQIANIMDIFSNPNDQSNTERIARSMAGSLIKGFVEPAIVRQGLKTYDPTVKEVYSFWDELAKDVPGYGGPPRINPRTGEAIMNPPRLLSGTPAGWFLPNAPVVADDDAVRMKMLELRIPFPAFPKAYGGGNPSQSAFAYSGPMGAVKEAGAGVPYSPEQINKGQRYIHDVDENGMTADQEAKALIADPEFNKLAPIVQAEQLTAIYNSRISRSVGKLREEYPELDTQLEAKQQLRGELRASPEDRAAFDSEENATPDPIELPEPTQPWDNPSIEVPEQAPEAPQ